MKRDIKVLVAAHKPCRLPGDAMFLPIQVGAALRPPLPGLQSDGEGENISQKNPNYCELTALYWAWKNLDARYIGMAHYRRYFARGGLGAKWERIAGEETLNAALERADILLPKKRQYYIETTYSQYAHAHHAIDLDVTQEILVERWPEYLPAFEKVMKRTGGHRFNMFVMERGLLDEYCTWLFDILFELEARLDISGYSQNDARVFGFVSERLLDVWLETRGYAYTEMPVVFTEKQNWLKKGGAFLKRKFVGKTPDPAAPAAQPARK
ncbi:MAG: DUF4422 domain-containing protein [Oscillospiraceae bacterium]|nr:DUF4422 domain-containing protein [Oscillospiraceae bacterium]